MPPEQLEAARAADPIPRFRARLLQSAVCAEEELSLIEHQATEQVEEAIQEVLTSPLPEPGVLDNNLFDDARGIPA
jgi:pyruvate dehydrogenase E1 component alpha subunit